MENLSFKIISGRFIHQEDPRLYLKAYSVFKKTWLDTFTEIFGRDYCYTSTDFTRQDYIQCLFEGDVCVALDCIREVDLRSEADCDDIWLKPWKADQITKLLSDGYNRCLINSYFTVHEDYRKSQIFNKYSYSYILVCLSVLHQLELGAPLMLGMMRNNRSMNKLGVSWGSRTIESNIIHNTIPTDLVIFDSSSVQEASREFPSIVFEIFNSKNLTIEKRTKNAQVA